MHASSSLNASPMRITPIRPSASMDAAATLASELSNANTPPLTPAPVSLVEERSMRRLATLLFAAFAAYEAGVSDSSRLMSAKKRSFCESVKMLCGPVCVGVHSYPGLIQNARFERPSRRYFWATSCENLRPRSSAYSLAPSTRCMNSPLSTLPASATANCPTAGSSSIAVASAPLRAGYARLRTSRRSTHVVGKGSAGLGSGGLNGQRSRRASVGSRYARLLARSTEKVKAPLRS
mmetsp:Transcript_26111/g.53214  ORF Transcript_26111/g.53214 Transcript_26111/m.53214 type:complete len:236 (-) Transcript_26111:2649-3356(-)